jgi:hypothetical protein
MQFKARRYKIPPWPPRQVMIMKHDSFWFVDFETCGDAEIMHQMKRFCLRLKTEYKMKYVGYSFHVVFTGRLPPIFPLTPLTYLKIVCLIIISYYRLCPDTFMALLLYFNETAQKHVWTFYCQEHYNYLVMKFLNNKFRRCLYVFVTTIMVRHYRYANNNLL